VGTVYTLPAVAGAALSEEADQIDHITRGVLMVGSAAGQAEPALPSKGPSPVAKTMAPQQPERGSHGESCPRTAPSG
jgi:hypothetical protein